MKQINPLNFPEKRRRNFGTGNFCHFIQIANNSKGNKQVIINGSVCESNNLEHIKRKKMNITQSVVPHEINDLALSNAMMIKVKR